MFFGIDESGRAGLGEKKNASRFFEHMPEGDWWFLKSLPLPVETVIAYVFFSAKKNPPSMGNESMPC
jgi:hypothetical protein